MLSFRMHLKVTHKAGEVSSRVTNIYIQPRYSQCGLRRTKIDYSDALSTGLFRKVFTLFCHFTHPDNCLEVDVRSTLDERKVMTRV